MEWQGHKLKAFLEENGPTISELALKIGISRQSISSWIAGQAPKGEHLMALCESLNSDPSFFFKTEVPHTDLPLHRKRGAAKTTDASQKAAQALVSKYSLLFRQYPSPPITLRISARILDESTAEKTALMVREYCKIDSAKPLKIVEAFKLLQRLNIIPIVRRFPESIKSYAFFSKIVGYNVVFINSSSNVLDLVFAILHEAAHAILDLTEVEQKSGDFDFRVEEFADAVANQIQFHPAYLDLVSRSIEGCNIGTQVIKLKKLCAENHHSVYGIYTNLARMGAPIKLSKLDAVKSNSTLRKKTPSLNGVLFQNKKPREYLDLLQNISPSFLKMIQNNLESTSTRKLGELLGIEGEMDAKELREELVTRAGASA